MNEIMTRRLAKLPNTIEKLLKMVKRTVSQTVMARSDEFYKGKHFKVIFEYAFILRLT